MKTTSVFCEWCCLGGPWWISAPSRLHWTRVPATIVAFRRASFSKNMGGENCLCLSDHCCHGIFYFFESLAIFVQNCLFLNPFAVQSENVFPNLWSLVFQPGGGTVCIQTVGNILFSTLEKQNRLFISRTARERVFVFKPHAFVWLMPTLATPTLATPTLAILI